MTEQHTTTGEEAMDGDFSIQGSNVKTRVAQLINQGVTQAEIARESGISSTTLSRWLQGDYAGDSANVERKLGGFLQLRDSRREASARVKPAPDYIATESGEKVLALVRFAQMMGVMCLVYGGAGLGKTKAVLRHRNVAPSVWVATMTAATKGLVSCLQVICKAIGLKEALSGALAMQDAIVATLLKTRGVLVVDEAQHLGWEALEAVRALYDATGVGIVLMGNESVYSRLSGGQKADYISRLSSRITRRLHLLRATERDVKALLAAYDLTDAQSIRLGMQIAARPGALRVLCTTLQLASTAATAQTEAMSFQHLQTASAELTAEG